MATTNYAAWSEAGGRILREMYGPTFSSTWTNFPQAFIDWGYQYAMDSRSTDQYSQQTGRKKYTVEGHYNLGNALHYIGATNPGYFRYMCAKHQPPGSRREQLPQLGTYKAPDKRNLPWTAAFYCVAVNRWDGVIIISEAFSPEHMRTTCAPQDPIQPAEYPSLRHSSDIIYGLWESAREFGSTVHPTKKLRHIFTWGITNAELLGVIGKTIADFEGAGAVPQGKTIAQVLEFPGIMIDIEKDHGKCLLGTALGKMVGRLLSQHYYQFGHKVVSQVSIFRINVNQEAPYALYWEVLDYAEFYANRPTDPG